MPDQSPPASDTSPTNRLAAASAVAGLLAAVCLAAGCFTFGLTLPLALLAALGAIPTGVLGLHQIDAGRGSGRSLARAGIACGIAVLLLTLGTLLLVYLGVFAGGNLDQLFSTRFPAARAPLGLPARL